MPNHKSQEKRDRQRVGRYNANRLVVGRMRTAVKAARAAIDAKSADAASLVKTATSLIDKAVSRGSVPRRTASRYISRLVRRGA